MRNCRGLASFPANYFLKRIWSENNTCTLKFLKITFPFIGILGAATFGNPFNLLRDCLKEHMLRVLHVVHLWILNAEHINFFATIYIYIYIYIYILLYYIYIYYIIYIYIYILLLIYIYYIYIYRYILLCQRADLEQLQHLRWKAKSR